MGSQRPSADLVRDQYFADAAKCHILPSQLRRVFTESSPMIIGRSNEPQISKDISAQLTLLIENSYGTASVLMTISLDPPNLTSHTLKQAQA